MAATPSGFPWPGTAGTQVCSSRTHCAHPGYLIFSQRLGGETHPKTRGASRAGPPGRGRRLQSASTPSCRRGRRRRPPRHARRCAGSRHPMRGGPRLQLGTPAPASKHKLVSRGAAWDSQRTLRISFSTSIRDSLTGSMLPSASSRQSMHLVLAISAFRPVLRCRPAFSDVSGGQPVLGCGRTGREGLWTSPVVPPHQRQDLQRRVGRLVRLRREWVRPAVVHDPQAVLGHGEAGGHL